MNHYAHFFVHDNSNLSYEQEAELLDKYKIELYDGRAEAHLRSLINGSGSTSEGLVNAFVKGDYKTIIKERGSIESGWDRLDGYQKHLVLCFRVLIHRGVKNIQGEGKDFIEYFKNSCCYNEYRELEYAYDTDDIPYEEVLSMAETACKTVSDAIGEPIPNAFIMKVYNPETEEFDAAV